MPYPVHEITQKQTKCTDPHKLSGANQSNQLFVAVHIFVDFFHLHVLELARKVSAKLICESIAQHWLSLLFY